MTFNNPLLDHLLPWTEEEYLSLPEGSLVELIDGELRIAACNSYPHQDLRMRLCMELDRLLPSRLDPLPGLNVRLAPGRIVMPDIVVVVRGNRGLVQDASDIALIGEIESATSQCTDRILKPALYATAGIPWYLRVELEPTLQLVLQRPVGTISVEHARAGSGELLELPGFDCSIEVDALVDRDD